MFWRKKAKDPIVSIKVDFHKAQMGITMEGNFGIILPVLEKDKKGKEILLYPSFQCLIEEAEALAQCALQAIREEKKIRANPH